MSPSPVPEGYVRGPVFFDGGADHSVYNEVARGAFWNLAGGYQRDAGGGIRPVLDIHDNTLVAFAEACGLAMTLAGDAGLRMAA